MFFSIFYHVISKIYDLYHIRNNQKLSNFANNYWR